MKIGLPKLQQKTNSNGLNSSTNSLSQISFRMTNMSNSMMQVESSDLGNCKEGSCVYVYDNNRVYRLKFHASEVTIEPVIMKPRAFEQNETDKCLQPRCKHTYSMNNKMSKFKMNSMSRNYTLDYDKDNISIMSNKRPVLTPIKFEKLPKKLVKSNISNKKSNIGHSIINISSNDTCFQIHTGLIEMKSIKPIDAQREENKKVYLEKHNMSSDEVESNRASIIVYHKSDLLKFRFKLSQVNYERINEKISIGIQAKDDNVYIRSFSTINNRFVFIPIPNSTYKYEDPMIELKQKNSLLKLTNTAPAWMKEVRDQRNIEYKKCHGNNVESLVSGLQHGSSISFDNRNHRLRAKSGVATLNISDQDYEDWVVNYQKSKDAERVEDQLSKTKNNEEKSKKQQLHASSISDADIHDWDLVMNDV